MGSSQLAVRPITTKRDGRSGGGIAAALTERSSSRLADASFRVYYSLRAGAVPFLWESTPGTPKSTAAEAVLGTAGEDEALPPISPPPSYLSSSHLKVARSSSSSSWTAATAGGVLRALRGVLGLKKRATATPRGVVPPRCIFD